MAVDVSTQQMALTRDTLPGGFMERVTAMLAFVASSILTESAATAHHQPRAFFAQRVINAPQASATQAGPQIVMGVNIVATTTYDEETKTSTCTAADIDLESQIRSLWNALAAIDTPT
jgi:hypothetical protein